MEMSHIRYFLAVCREGGFTRAARRCGVAQPSLTRAIKVLERELGGTLFMRRPAGAEPTELALELKPYFAAIQCCVDAIKRSPRQPDILDRKIAGDIARRFGLE